MSSQQSQEAPEDKSSSYSKALSTFVASSVRYAVVKPAMSTAKFLVSSGNKKQRTHADDQSEDSEIDTIDDCQVPEQQKESEAVQQPQTPKCVSFSPMVMSVDVLHLNDYTSEEREASFCSSQDFMRIKHEIKDTIKRIEQGICINENDLCRRGIESLTHHGKTLRIRRRTVSRQAVFEAQVRVYSQEKTEVDEIDDGEEQSVTDDASITTTCPMEAIAAAYVRTVVESDQLAYLAGLFDERVAKKSRVEEETEAKKQQKRSADIALLEQRCMQRRIPIRHRTQYAVSTAAA